MDVTNIKKRISHACEMQDSAALASIIEELDKNGTLDNYLKGLLLTKEPDELYDLLGLVDLNSMISGGTLAATRCTLPLFNR